VHDAADHAAVIDAGFAPHVFRQMLLDLPPLFVVEPKQIASHCLCSESKLQRISNRISRQQFYWVLALVQEWCSVTEGRSSAARIERESAPTRIWLTRN
jgi:hypothetical protein